MNWQYHIGFVALLLCLSFLSGSSAPSATAEAALERLGRRLLAEQRLSADGSMSCLSCHQPERGYSDGRAVAYPGGLNTPPLWGLAERQTFGWFSPELTTLEAALLRPLTDPNEMGPLRAATLARLRADPATYAAYRTAFPDALELVTWEQTSKALAAALRTIPLPPRASEPLDAAAQRGRALFGELGCATCHRPPSFAAASYHTIGLQSEPSRNGGRARVPSLRGLIYTPPYFHNGSATTLEAVIDHYARGGDSASPAISPLLLTEQDRRDLVAFLKSL